MCKSLQRFAKKRPACTCIAIVILALQILRHLFHWKIKKYGLRALKVIQKREYYRLFTNAIFHNSWQHLTINLGTTFAVGPALENRIGSRNFILITLWSILLTSLLYIPSAYGLSYILHDVNWRKKGVKGFSGVLFHWTYLISQKSRLRSLPFFDGLNIPSHYYPWVSLLIMYLIDPKNQRGTLMHVMGILVGFLHTKGFLRELLPSAPVWKTVKKAEDKDSSENVDQASLREARLRRF
mmetsp:Transcript_28450/g.43448  ORF Transcript_28450/g.43448 Transcript_28450/m.43448 type:complete len:239 (-) Transcript_28450:245-961(-)